MPCGDGQLGDYAALELDGNLAQGIALALVNPVQELRDRVDLVIMATVRGHPFDFSLIAPALESRLAVPFDWSCLLRSIGFHAVEDDSAEIPS